MSKHTRNNLTDLMQDLMKPEYAAALVAWDRDVAPLVEHHRRIWGQVRDEYLIINNDRTHWVSMSFAEVGPPHGACCILEYDPAVERWAHNTTAPYLYHDCPLRKAGP